jgi:CO/xanthine dehydrogenase Mo-binding subunit
VSARDRADFELAQHETSRLHWFDVDRRRFLRMLGGGILIGAAAPRLEAQESGRAPGGGDAPREISAWIHIGADGRVTVFTGKVDMGQNIRTSLTQQVAEELRVPMSSISLVMGDTAKTPYDMGTFGSRTTPTMGPQLRRAAAAARQALIELAADHWKVEPASLSAEGGRIVAASGRGVAFGDLTHGREIVRVIPAEPPLEPPAEWKLAGRDCDRVEGRDFVTGRHVYPSDVTRPGMLFGKVLRPAGFQATLSALRTEAAEKFPGVRIVRDGDFVGVVAPDAWTAERAVAALAADWKVPEQPSGGELFEHLKRTAETAGGRGDQKTGSVAGAMASAEVKLERSYTVEYIAHAPLEPRAAVAEWTGDRLDVWTGTQRPFAVREELAQAFRIATDQVRVRVPDTGSAYGGKHTGDAALEAARLAKAAGKPVRVAWTREEEFTWAYFRPAGVITVSSGARRDGTLVAWEFHNINSGPAAIATPYAVANQRIQFHPAKSPLRQGSYRGLAATANHFARETHMDEIAREAKMDPLAFRKKNLTDARLAAVFEAAAAKFGWEKRSAAPGRGFGIAGGVEKGGYVATCAEVEVDPATRRLRIVRVVEAFEAGAVVNPDGLRNQVEGAIVQGLGGALFEAIRFSSGKIDNARFAQYRVPRFADVPSIEIVILDRKDLPPAGAGETPIVGIAPAVGNAIFDATGVRLRALPLAPEGVVKKA